jgi:hypothetical protein
MQLRRVAVGVVVPLVLLGTWAGGADAPKKAEADNADVQKVTSKPIKHVSAATVDFKKEFKLPLASLGTLGGRLEAARKAPDPLAMAHMANELAVAEKVSGKQAPITADGIMDEANELAKMRRQEAELKSMIALTAQMAKQKARLRDLRAALTATQQQAKQESAAVRKGQEPKAAFRKVLVNNGSTQTVDIWVNGYQKTQVGPGQSKWFVVEHKWNPTVLKAYGNEDSTVWGPRYIWGKFIKYTWNLTGTAGEPCCCCGD